jgi:hypothetical protein
VNVLKQEKKIQVLNALIEGCSIRSVERMTGSFGDSGNTFHYRGDKSPKYVELVVRARDLRKVISGMKNDSSRAM